MEKSVTLRFYDVRRSTEDRPAFADVLRAISEKALTDREARVGIDDILVRLEDFVEHDGEMHGQLIRGQTGNRPGRMLPAGTDNLPFNEPLGHGIAFRFRARDGLLAVQFDSKILSPGRILDYLYQHEPLAEFRLTPKMRDDAWQRFNELPMRKFEVAIAGHANAQDLDNDAQPVWQNVAAISHATTRLVDTVSTPMLPILIQLDKIDSALLITHRLDAYVVGDRSKTDWRNDLSTPGLAELGITARKGAPHGHYQVARRSRRALLSLCRGAAVST